MITIKIVGPPNSGKSTMARELAEMLNYKGRRVVNLIDEGRDDTQYNKGSDILEPVVIMADTVMEEA